MTYPREPHENERLDVLTSIHHAYTVGDTNEPESEEMNKVIVKNFIDTLAEVSLSIVKRQVKGENH